MLLVTLLSFFTQKGIGFPIWFWMPWIIYIIVYLIIDFSFLGLQLTLQYTLPILIGVVASGIKYAEDDLLWIFKWFMRLILLVYSLFLYANIFGNGYTPGMASMPMLFSISISLLTGLYFTTKKNIYLILIILLIIAPVIEVTRMGIAATSAVFILHFANKNLSSKILFGSIGFFVFLIVFNSKSFQEKTFYGGHGTLSELTIDYYDNKNIRSSGRISYKHVLDPGLKAEPVWGNGPRADNQYLVKITKMRAGESHNDYLSVRFNYGYVGLSLLLFGFITTFVALYKVSSNSIDNSLFWIISTSALTLFIPFLMFMLTDNILKYTVYFPNYFFALIGITYSIKRDEDLSNYSVVQ